MKFWKFAVAAMTVLCIYTTTVAFTPDDTENPNCDAPTMIFTTDCHDEVARVADLLNEEQMEEVNRLSIAFIRIKITTKKKDDIDIQGGGSTN